LISGDGNILHFSGHGIIDPENPTLSKLDFGRDFLTIEEVYQLNRVPSIMILNACNSQNGKTNIGDGINGFARAFHAAGTHASISNIWEVDDEASNEFFRQFYSNLSKGKDIQSSLRKVQLTLIKREDGFGAPYYWAGHKLFGDAKIVVQTKTPKTTFFIWILGVLGLVVAITIIVSTLGKRKLKPKRQ
jgi:CHAT domain-containing protein